MKASKASRSLRLRKPRSDDRRLWDVLFALNGSIAVYAAHKLGMFSLLAQQPRALDQVCRAMKIAPRPAEALLAVSGSLGFVRKQRDGYYRLTPLAEDYLLESSPTYFGGNLRFPIENDFFTRSAMSRKRRLQIHLRHTAEANG